MVNDVSLRITNMTKTVFATLDASGAPVELRLGEPFTTHHVIVASEEEAAWSFTAIGEKAAFEVNHGPNALNLYADADLVRFCIAKLTIGNPPSGKQLGSYAFSLSGGQITVTPTWVSTPPAPVPTAVSAVNGKLALARAGYLSTIKAIVAAGDDETKIWWDAATEFRRTHPMVVGIGAAIGLTSGQIDDLFRIASEIN